MKSEFIKEKPNLDVICNDFPRLLKELGIQVEPVEKRFQKVKGEFDQTQLDLDKYKEIVILEVSEVEQFRRIMADLREWVPGLEHKSVAAQPVTCDDEAIEKLTADVEVSFFRLFKQTLKKQK